MRWRTSASVLGVSVVMAGLLLAACGDDGAGPTTSASVASSATGDQGAATTATTEAVPEPATTIASPVGTEAARTTELALRPDGLGVVAFGDPPEMVLTTVEGIVGFPPTADTGWTDPADAGFAVCPGTVVRLVDFEGLLLMFTDGGLYAPAGIEHFFSYAYGSEPPVIASGPPDNINLGATVADLLAVYPDAELVPDDPRLGPSFFVQTPAIFPLLFGTLSGLGPSDQIESIRGGTGCGG